MSRLRALGWTVLALALLLAMRESTPNYDALVGPLVQRGRSGEYLAGRRFEARVDAVHAARLIRYERRPDSVEQRDSSGVWLVVEASARATQVPVTLGNAQLLTRDGRRYAQSGRLPLSPPLLAARELQPGIESRGVLLFELPADALAGAVLALSENRLSRLDSELHIDLGLAVAPAPREFYDLVRP